MKTAPLNIISIGYAKRIFDINSREFARMKSYSEVVDQFHIVVFTDKKDGLPTFKQVGNLFIYGTNSQTKFSKIFDAIKIGREITKNQSDKKWLLSAQDPFETSFVSRSIARRDKDSIQTQVHGDIFNPFSYQESLLQRLRVLYAKLTIRKANGIRVVSERIKKSLINLGVPDNKITVLPIESDLKNFIEAAERREYEEGNKCNFLYVGRLAEEKNVSMIIEAFGSLPINDNSTLTILGEGSQKIEIENLITNLHLEDKVKIIDWSEDVANVMLEHDVLCLSSNHEGWGMVLLEAAATGMPIVTTDVGCVGEAIKDGVHAQVVKPQDTTAFAAALKKYIENPSLREQHGQAGRELAQKRSENSTDYLNKMVDSWSSCLD